MSKCEAKKFESNKKSNRVTLSPQQCLIVHYNIQKIIIIINEQYLKFRGWKIVAYANNLVLISERRYTMSQILLEVDTDAAKIVLKINSSYTKWVRCNKNTANRNKQKILIFEKAS